MLLPALLANLFYMQSQKYVAAQQQALDSMRAASDDTAAADGGAPDAKKQRGEQSFLCAVQLSMHHQPVANVFLFCLLCVLHGSLQVRLQHITTACSTVCLSVMQIEPLCFCPTSAPGGLSFHAAAAAAAGVQATAPSVCKMRLS
jgi:hypothetical protein